MAVSCKDCDHLVRADMAYCDAGVWFMADGDYPLTVEDYKELINAKQFCPEFHSQHAMQILRAETDK